MIRTQFMDWTDWISLSVIFGIVAAWVLAFVFYGCWYALPLAIAASIWTTDLLKAMAAHHDRFSDFYYMELN